MGDKSKIEWTDATWNPLRALSDQGKQGWHCEHVSEGCRHCYAEGMNEWRGTGLPYRPGFFDNASVTPFLHKATVAQPLRWKAPRKIFVCSMTDLFARFVPDAWIDRLFAVMALCPQHSFMVLTKRAERMRAYFANGLPQRFYTISYRAHEIAGAFPKLRPAKAWTAPLGNVWLGVSVENQAAADERIPHLLATPAAVRFISAEPLLGPVDLTRHLRAFNSHDIGLGDDPLAAALLAGSVETGHAWAAPALHWVIAGGESGPNARPMHPAWARSLRDQCAEAGVPFFFKQWGEFLPQVSPYDNFETVYVRLGKKRAGRLLDGVEHSAWPA